MTNQIILQARDESNHIAFSMRFSYASLQELQHTLELTIPQFLTFGVAIHENLEFPLTINGVKLEQLTTKANKNKNVLTP